MNRLEHDIPDDSRQAQQARVLLALIEHGSLTTDDIREYLGVMHPAGRISELRRQGNDIVTLMRWTPNHNGDLHKQALYQLRGGDRA